VPLLLTFKTGDNPYKDKKNVLTVRQIKKKRRMMSHVKR
jgi:GTPase